MRAWNTPEYERVRALPEGGPMVRLDFKTGIAAPYPRQQHRNQMREEARLPSFTDRLAFALSQIEWLPPEVLTMGAFDWVEGGMLSAMGLMSTSPMSPTIGRRVKRYRAAYLSERQEPSADYSKRYQALFTVHAGEAVR